MDMSKYISVKGGSFQSIDNFCRVKAHNYEGVVTFRRVSIFGFRLVKKVRKKKIAKHSWKVIKAGSFATFRNCVYSSHNGYLIELNRNDIAFRLIKVINGI